MPMLWLPDYQRKLVLALQKLQNSDKFCDTLLQTEGVSIPTHSCVLGALSPVLSQRLLASAAPPAGQKTKLQLPTVKPQTLIKLVCLIYSGELEVNGVEEKQDVLAAVHSFGFPDLSEEEKFDVKSFPEGKLEYGKNDIVKRDVQTQVTPRSFYVSTGTQTLAEDTHEVTESATTVSMSTVCHGSEKVTPETLSCISFTGDSTEYSDEESDYMTSALPKDSLTWSKPKDGGVVINSAGTSAFQAGDGPAMEENGETSDQGKTQRGSAVEKVQKTVARKSMEKMREMMEATQISIKVKLRRRQNKKKTWEVVNNTQDGDAALRPDNSKSQQEDLTPVCPSGVSQTSVTEPNKPPQTGYGTPEPVPQGDSSAPDSLPPPRPAEETDEQIEKLLEDIMIGLNILPNTEKAKNKPQHGGLSSGGGPGRAQEDKASNCACCEDYGTGCNDNSAAPHQPSCSVRSSVESSRAAQENSSPSTERTELLQNSQSSKTSSCLSDNHDTNPPVDPNDLELLPLAADSEMFSLSDLQFLPCLSPLETTNGNKTPTAPRHMWLTGDRQPLVFPLNLSSSSNTDSTEAVEERPAKPESSEPINRPPKLETERTSDKDVPQQKAKRKCPNPRLNKTCKSMLVENADSTIHLGHCLVSLSSNNVLAKDRRKPQSEVPSNVSETEQRRNVTRRLRSNTKFRRDCLTSAPISTKTKSESILSIPVLSAPNPEACKPQRKRGRPRKDLSTATETVNPTVDQKEGMKDKLRKRTRDRDLDQRPSERATPADVKQEQEDVDDGPSAEKRCRLVSLKQFEYVIKRQQSKAQQRKDGEKEPVADSEKGLKDNVDSSELCKEPEENGVTQDGHEQVCSERPSSPMMDPQNTPPQAANKDQSSCFEKINLYAGGDPPEFCSDVHEEEATKLLEEERPKTSPELCDEGISDSACEKELTIDEVDSTLVSANTHAKSSSADPGPDVPGSRNCNHSKTVESKATDEGAGCPPDDEEEVDVLHNSTPDRASVTEEAHKTEEVSSEEEEEEEESNDVDVTGSEMDE